MKVLVNTDKHIEGSERLQNYIDEKMGHALKHFADRLTRIEIHLSDQNGDKPGADDIQCRVEVRPKGLQPVTVTARNANLDLSIADAIEKMKAALTTAYGKQDK